MTSPSSSIIGQSLQILNDWLKSCTRGSSVSRNTVAVGIVVFDHLRHKCPLAKADVFSAGGELKGSRGGLSNILESYGIPDRYLKECTTRQSHQDAQRLFEAFEWGQLLCPLSVADRDDVLGQLIDRLKAKAEAWLNRPNLKFDLDRQQAPREWVHVILAAAKGRSNGIVEQHLVGAKLARRHQDIEVPNFPAHAADVQTERLGDYSLFNVVYHVTALPSPAVLEKCAKNLKAGKHPILLVPAEKVSAAAGFADLQGIAGQVTTIAIEDFLAMNIIEMAISEKADFFEVLKDIVATYNQRLKNVETDLSLQIEVK